MNIPRKMVEELGSRVDPRLLKTAVAGDADTLVLKPHEQNVVVDSTLGTVTVYLPDVAEAEGKEYSITAPVGNTKTVTVTEKASGNSQDFGGDYSLNAAYDRLLIKSDGVRWWVIDDMFT